MGFLRLGALRSQVDDQTLAQLERVILTRMLGERSFRLQLHRGRFQSSEPVTVSPEQPIVFAFDAEFEPPIDERMAAEMLEEIEITGGLHFVVA
ncbi:hypothetical protein EAO79_06780 [Plantibacter sp. PA-3-X8]|uniref:DUF7882 family protein n=1 Tax=Plantibacter sp. PA-3-X8 TaxID=2480625 RepID=UPI000F5DE358|nr:hypothetical protein [Plantibacter sp. PA-3-X8]AZH82628.1 hypothetical protein EAO79_06780 [Plantibacter sp. PA-3-X8]